MSLRDEKEIYTFDNKNDRRLVPDGPKMSSSPKDQKDSGQIEGQTQTSTLKSRKPVQARVQIHDTFPTRKCPT